MVQVGYRSRRVGAIWNGEHKTEVSVVGSSTFLYLFASSAPHFTSRYSEAVHRPHQLTLCPGDIREQRGNVPTATHHPTDCGETDALYKQAPHLAGGEWRPSHLGQSPRRAVTACRASRWLRGDRPLVRGSSCDARRRGNGDESTCCATSEGQIRASIDPANDIDLHLDGAEG